MTRSAWTINLPSKEKMKEKYLLFLFNQISKYIRCEMPGFGWRLLKCGTSSSAMKVRISLCKIY